MVVPHFLCPARKTLGKFWFMVVSRIVARRHDTISDLPRVPVNQGGGDALLRWLGIKKSGQ
jgi:hypothetical protein